MKNFTQKELFDTLEVGDIVTVEQEGYTCGTGVFVRYEECPNQGEDDSDCKNCEGFIRLEQFKEKYWVENFRDDVFEDCVVNSVKKTYVVDIKKPKPIIFLKPNEFMI